MKINGETFKKSSLNNRLWLITYEDDDDEYQIILVPRYI